MKKNYGLLKAFVLIALLAGSILIITGCASNKGIYDPSVAPEQLVTLTIDRDLRVRQFNGNTVPWAPSYNNPFKSGVVVQIPPGSHYFLIDYFSGGSLATRWAENIRYSHTFEAGKFYTMYPVVANYQVSIKVEEK
jgi:hypothetical protein